MFHDYREGAGVLARLAMPSFAHYLRLWDAASAARVDSFVANSATVAGRIRRYYGLDATVIHPPVDTAAFSPCPSSELGDYYLMAGELVSYKRPDLAVRAFNELKLKLVVIGGGDMLSEIRRLAGPTVSVLGPQPFESLKHHYARCRALIFPGEEDFGMVPVEAMASGRPVLAFGRGGATETITNNVTGLFFDEQTVGAIAESVARFSCITFEPEAIIAHAQQFGREPFIRKMRSHIELLLPQRAQSRVRGQEALG
jgi:glycosyltransferase involved in cell wall biosynthesis